MCYKINPVPLCVHLEYSLHILTLLLITDIAAPVTDVHSLTHLTLALLCLCLAGIYEQTFLI